MNTYFIQIIYVILIINHFFQTAWLGPLCLALVQQLTGSYRQALLSVLFFFITGLFFLFFYNHDKALLDTNKFTDTNDFTDTNGLTDTNNFTDLNTDDFTDMDAFTDMDMKKVKTSHTDNLLNVHPETTTKLQTPRPRIQEVHTKNTFKYFQTKKNIYIVHGPSLPFPIR